jgi:hypothetical protein
MSRKYFLLSVLYAFFILPVFAAEVDSVTTRNVHLDNSIETLNGIIDQRLREGVRKANDRQGYAPDSDDLPDGWMVSFCDEDVLYAELIKAIFQSLTVSLGLKGYDLDKQLRVLLARQSYSLPLNDSIYRDIGYLEGFSLNLKELSDVVNLDGNLVGLDKIGHFFAQGWQYFEMTAFDDKTLYEAIAWGREKETGLYGYTTTGIFSYADLVANLNGWRFWNKVLHQRDDPLKGMLGNFFDRPYVSCDIQIMDSIRNRKLIRAWEYNTSFDLSDYIDGTWDEGNNCNSYADPMIEAKVMARIAQVAPDFSCPLSARDCVDARDKYGDYAKYVLHPLCLTVRQAGS